MPALDDLLGRARRELLAAIAPPACLACGVALASADATLCEGCRRALPWLAAPCCLRCALPLPCGDPCPAVGASFTRAWAPLAHDGVARALVASLKFRGALPVAELMAAQLAAGVPRDLLGDDAGADGTALVPVPLPAARRQTRGFDQARRIATALAVRTGVPLTPCLRRAGPATRQLGASAAARRGSGRLDVRIAGAPPARAVLVDDVHTTGATFEACAAALREAGCREVVAIAYARALRRSSKATVERPSTRLR